MKKTFSFILALLFIFTLQSQVAAETKPSIFGDIIECSSDETIKYAVKIKDNPGIAGFLVSVYTDNDWLYFDEDIEQGDFSGLGTITASYEPQRVNILWFNPDNVTSDGTLFTLTVHVSPSAPSGDYPIRIAVSEKNTMNEKRCSVDFDTEDGCIRVAENDSSAEEGSKLATRDDLSSQERKTYTALWAVLIAVAVGIFAFTALILRKKNK